MTWGFINTGDLTLRVSSKPYKQLNQRFFSPKQGVLRIELRNSQMGGESYSENCDQLGHIMQMGDGGIAMDSDK